MIDRQWKNTGHRWIPPHYLQDRRVSDLVTQLYGLCLVPMFEMCLTQGCRMGAKRGGAGSLLRLRLQSLKLKKGNAPEKWWASAPSSPYYVTPLSHFLTLFKPRDCYSSSQSRSDIAVHNATDFNAELDISLAHPWSLEAISLAATPNKSAGSKREETKIEKYSKERHAGKGSPSLIPLVFKHFERWGNKIVERNFST